MKCFLQEFARVYFGILGRFRAHLDNSRFQDPLRSKREDDDSLRKCAATVGDRSQVLGGGVTAN